MHAQAMKQARPRPQRAQGSLETALCGKERGLRPPAPWSLADETETRTEQNQRRQVGLGQGTMAHEGNERQRLSQRKAGLRCVYTNSRPRNQEEPQRVRKREIRK